VWSAARQSKPGGGVIRALPLIPSLLQPGLWEKSFTKAHRAEEVAWTGKDAVNARARRDALVQACGNTAGVVVDLGCAGGRNLEALGAAFPEARVIGIDLSAEALTAAARRTERLPNIQVARVHRPRDAALVRDLQGGIDILVLSEVLPRLGGVGRITEALAPFAPLLRDGSRVVMADRGRGCDRLHRVAARALDVPIVLSRHPADSAGAYTLTVAALPVPLLSLR